MKHYTHLGREITSQKDYEKKPSTHWHSTLVAVVIIVTVSFFVFVATAVAEYLA